MSVRRCAVVVKLRQERVSKDAAGESYAVVSNGSCAQ